ncbi:hypothetical protein [Chromobacterium violaceum]|uniref:hypothetical protein n=1 Tax=Chromobacterium violaceum TaxID=536 RepID=UPI001CE10D2F|nr:hypothetical protein [Chromobacterium violaceum]
MKNVLLCMASLVLTALLSACAAVGEPVPSGTPAQIAAQVCPGVLVVTQALVDTPGVLAPTDAAHLAAIQPAISRVCAAASSPSSADLRGLAADAAPALIAAVNGSNLSADEKARLSLAVTLAQALVLQKLAAPAATASAAQ